MNKDNLSYQDVPSPLGGSYSENKLRRLGLPDLGGKSFLDLGCNSGFYCAHAKQMGARRVVGVDIDKAVIAEARRNHPQVEFLDQGWTVLPSGAFDVIIFLSAIHYADDPVALVARLYDLLNPGGLLVLEGGILDIASTWTIDCLIPGWRQVGDRCRHLSSGYLRNHLLASFDWKVHGPSEPRGGDEVARHVVHASKASRGARAASHTVDLVDYVRGLSWSARTIVAKQPAYAYVNALIPGQSDAALVETLLADSAKCELFLDDLAFALAPSQPRPVQFAASVKPDSLAVARNGLRHRGIAVQG